MIVQNHKVSAKSRIKEMAPLILCFLIGINIAVLVFSSVFLTVSRLTEHNTVASFIAAYIPAWLTVEFFVALGFKHSESAK
jgi:hypothetical protein